MQSSVYATAGIYNTPPLHPPLNSIHRQPYSTLAHWSTLHPPPTTTHSGHQAHSTCIFQECHTYYQQIRGAGVGSQLSPALCNVAITLIEHSWHQTYSTFLQQPSIHLFNTRYVDNRYTLISEQFRQPLPIATFAHPEFYGHPVEIETVEDNHL